MTGQEILEEVLKEVFRVASCQPEKRPGQLDACLGAVSGKAVVLISVIDTAESKL